VSAPYLNPLHVLYPVNLLEGPFLSCRLLSLRVRSLSRRNNRSWPPTDTCLANCLSRLHVSRFSARWLKTCRSLYNSGQRLLYSRAISWSLSVCSPCPHFVFV